MLTFDKEIEEVVRLRDEHDLTFDQIAAQLGFSRSTAQRRYAVGLVQEALGEKSNGASLPEIEPIEIKDVPDYIQEDREAIERFKPMVIVGDAMITADWHIPLHDPKMVNRLIAKSKELGIKQLLIGGDFFHMDSFGSYLPYQPEAAWSQEKYDANLIMKVLLKHFDAIFFTYGNHDYRVTKSIGFKHSFTECMENVFDTLTDEEWSKLYLSNLDYMLYIPDELGEREFRLCHPSKHFSSNPLVVPKKLATKYGCSIISGHSHHAAIGFAHNGWDLIIEPGGLYHKERTEYIQQSNANHEWVQGFVSFKDGVPVLYSPLLGNI